MAQERIQKQKTNREQEGNTEETNTGVTTNEVSEKAGQTVADIDEVLDAQLDEEILAELDDILEENAAEFVMGYVQQGGE